MIKQGFKFAIPFNSDWTCSNEQDFGKDHRHYKTSNGFVVLTNENEGNFEGLTKSELEDIKIIKRLK